MPPNDKLPGVAAVRRALTLLAAFDAQHLDLSLAELSQRTGLYKSTILRLGETLERFHFLQRSASGRYKVGSEPMRLSALCRADFHPAEVVMPVLRELAAATLDRGAGGLVLQAFTGVPGERLDRMRRALVAVTLGDRDRETAAVACPLFGVGDRLEWALSISGPLSRFTRRTFNHSGRTLPRRAESSRVCLAVLPERLSGANVPVLESIQ